MNKNSDVLFKELDLPDSLSDISPDNVSDANFISFLVRMWKEESVSPEYQTIWRGHITSIPNGERHYFADIHEISNWIITQLKSRE